MLKRYTAIITAFIFIVTMLPFTFTQKVHAYQNNSYFNDLKIGLLSMSSTTATVTLNGEYTVNGQPYPSGSVLSFGVNGTTITFNGTLQSQFSLVPKDKSNFLTLTVNSISNKYMGSFLFKTYNGKILPINTIDMENYLKGVVGYEMSDNFPMEALKAQAIAARNYALSRIGYETAKGYDFDDTVNYQVYKGLNSSYTRVISAVDQTKGQVLLYNDKLVETLYSAWHGGVSENSENVWGNMVPYLRSVVDTFENDPWPNGNRVFTNAQIQSTLKTKGYLTTTDTFVSLDLNSITKFTSGRVSNINIIYTNSIGITQVKSVTKDNTRTFLSLPSNLYTVTYDAAIGSYTFSGKGNGHGLGMSQIGAKNRAAAGQTYDQILKFYFQNSYVQNLILKASLVALNQSSSNLFVGNTISFNSTAGNGNGYGYLFKYVIKNGDSVVLTKDYNNVSALDFVPSNTGNYTIEAYVKDSFSISEYDDKKVSNFSVYSPLVITSFSKDIENILVGDSVNFLTSVTGGSNKGVRYKYEVSKDGVSVLVKDFDVNNNFIYTPKEVGNYEVTVYVLDSISNKTYDAISKVNFETKDKTSITNLNLYKTTYFVDETVTLNVENGKANTLNKFVVLKDGTEIFTKDYAVNSLLQYTPTAAGNYEIQVFAKNSLEQITFDDSKSINFVVYNNPQLTNATTSKTEYLAGQTITVNTSASLGSGSYLYKYIISKDGSSLLTKDYSSENILQYTTIEAGEYSIEVYVKDALSTKDYDQIKHLSVKVYNKPTMSFSASQTSTLALNSVSYSINSTNGSGNSNYRLVIIKDNNLISDSGYSTQNNFTFIPDSAGIYQVTGYIKDSLSENEFDAQNTSSLSVYNPQLGDVNVNGYFYEGKSLNFNATSIGASPSGFTYKYEVYSNFTLIASSNFFSTSTFTFTPAISGNYLVKVYGKDGLSSKAYDSLKQFNIIVNKKPLYLSILPLKLGMQNNDVVSLQNALITLGYNISKPDGYFGTSTKNAVTSFQKKKGLTSDGIVGSMTYVALNEALIEKSGTKSLTY